MVDFGVRQSRLNPVVQSYHQHKAGVRRLKTLATEGVRAIQARQEDPV